MIKKTKIKTVLAHHYPVQRTFTSEKIISDYILLVWIIGFWPQYANDHIADLGKFT